MNIDKKTIIIILISLMAVIMSMNCVSATDSISNLGETTVTANSITWTWTNSTIWDYNHTMIYINGTFVTNVSNSTNSYVASGFAERSYNTISTHTVNVSGIINTTWVNDTARTLDVTPPQNITGLSSTVAPTSITWTWTNPSDSDFNYTTVYIDGVFATNVSNASSSYVATGLTENTTHNISTAAVDLDLNMNTSWLNATATTSIAPPAPVTSKGGGSGTGEAKIVDYIKPDVEEPVVEEPAEPEEVIPEPDTSDEPAVEEPSEPEDVTPEPDAPDETTEEPEDAPGFGVALMLVGMFAAVYIIRRT